jgi:hypothetical protein
MDLVATFAWDRLMKFVFARDILIAGIEGTTMKDVFSLARTFAVLGFLMYTFLGNSDTWDELLAMEEMAMNATVSDDSIVENLTASGCLDGVCEAINESLQPALLHDEF